MEVKSRFCRWIFQSLCLKNTCVLIRNTRVSAGFARCEGFLENLGKERFSNIQPHFKAPTFPPPNKFRGIHFVPLAYLLSFLFLFFIFLFLSCSLYQIYCRQYTNYSEQKVEAGHWRSSWR